MLHKNYISFSCITCKSQISVRDKFFVTTECPECSNDWLKNSLENKVPIRLIQKVKLETNIKKISEQLKKEKELEEVKDFYSKRTYIDIKGLKKYFGFNDLMAEIGFKFKEVEDSLNVDRKDFEVCFKDSNCIYREIVNLHDFHLKIIENPKSIIGVVYLKNDISLSTINTQFGHFFEINEDVEILFGAKTVFDDCEERVELFYDLK